MPHVLSKQENETFDIWAGITNVISVGESIDIANSTATAVDKDSTDVSADLLDLTGKAIYDTTKVQIRLKAYGTVAASPYKITFLIKTDTPNTWEVDILLKIKDY